ncbi:hypothetical protein ACFPIC_08210 [Arcanobacterium hippocoleae]|nr:hypothetical protein [Arcanobacterium hippocoleae]
MNMSKKAKILAGGGLIGLCALIVGISFWVWSNSDVRVEDSSKGYKQVVKSSDEDIEPSSVKPAAPVTPAPKPDQPVKPSVPAKKSPAVPSAKPVQPVKPAQPAPVAPAQPAQPVKPAQPAKPAKPSADQSSIVPGSKDPSGGTWVVTGEKDQCFSGVLGSDPVEVPCP